MAKTRPGAWVVVHCEYMGSGQAVFVDSLVFHVSSTLPKAETYIRGCGTSPYSWWEIRPFRIDCKDSDLDDAAQVSLVRYYSHKGATLRAAPYTRARQAYERKLARRK